MGRDVEHVAIVEQGQELPCWRTAFKKIKHAFEHMFARDRAQYAQVIEHDHVVAAAGDGPGESRNGRDGFEAARTLAKNRGVAVVGVVVVVANADQQQVRDAVSAPCGEAVGNGLDRPVLRRGWRATWGGVCAHRNGPYPASRC